jgi:MoaA/NifB/PqqE/SkfB family radical SAM enzyme
MELPKNFCIMPWVNLHIEADGRVRPCGASDYGPCDDNLHLSSYETLINSTHLKNLRLSHLEGVRPEACAQCYRLESVGQKSVRECSNEKFTNVIEDRINSTLKDGTILNTALLSLGAHLSNLCNFKCRTCRADSSTSWYAEANMLPRKKNFKDVLRPTKTKDDLWKLFDKILPNLVEINILGGEPLIEADYYRLLEKLIDLKKTDIVLLCSTNLSFLSLGNKQILDLWKKFSNVTLVLSYDGIEKKGEFIRKGTNWNVIIQNHKRIQYGAPLIKYVVSPTLSVLNIFHLIDLLKYLLRHEMITDGVQVEFNILNSPSFYNIQILNKNEFNSLEKLYFEFIENELEKSSIENKSLISEKLKNVLKYINIGSPATSVERKKFVIYNSQLNQFRDENLLSLFPELAGFYFDTVEEFN